MLPFIDLQAQYAGIQDKVQQRIQNVLDHGRFINGPEVGELEAALAAFCGCREAVCCASGTDALLLALLAKGAGPGKAVFTTPFTFIATAEVIALLGATPVFVDVAPDTFLMDLEKLEQAVEALKRNDPGLYPLPENHEELTAAGLITVDLFGAPCDYDEVNTFCEKHGLFTVQDAAQSMGAEYKGRKVGSLTDVCCTSFFPAKPLGCYGDGGAVFTDDADLAGVMRSLREHGKGSHKYSNERIGLNARLDTLQAAILLEKLEIFPEEIVKRNKTAAAYGELLQPLCPPLCLQRVQDDCLSVWAQYSLLAEDEAQRSALQEALKQAGVPSVVYYPRPLHVQPAFSFLGYRQEDFPVSMDLSSRIFSLPMHPYLECEQVAMIATTLRQALKG